MTISESSRLRNPRLKNEPPEASGPPIVRKPTALSESILNSYPDTINEPKELWEPNILCESGALSKPL